MRFESTALSQLLTARLSVITAGELNRYAAHPTNQWPLLMLIGHLPAGYLASSAALCHLQVNDNIKQRLLFVGVLCSVIPDFDALYFYLIDSSEHHHAFISHKPLFWMTVALLGGVVAIVMRSRVLQFGVLIGGANVLLHLALDSIAGRIQWLAPFSSRSLTLVEIPARYDSWIISFVLHWTFALEIVLLVAAISLYIWKQR